jgi:predicted TIM-barrel fold metal-dependent hydrolase
MGTIRYDAHCHIFTLKYALKEVKSILHDIIHGSYPWHEPDTVALQATGSKLADLKNLLRQLYELIHAAGGSEEANLDFLQQEAKKTFPADKLHIVPLMMDIFYLFAYPLQKDQDVQTAAGLKSGLVDEDEFQKQWDEVLDDFSDYLKTQHTAVGMDCVAGAADGLDLIMQMIAEERSVNKPVKLMGTTSVADGFYPTDGFCYHMDNLMALVKKRKGELFPFVAIDPRRPGMIDTLLSGQFFEGDEKFYGVKLYPRMGFHPLSKPMDKVYKYCSDHGLPITFHCGKGGFPPSTSWKYFDFGNPLNFEPVVKKYPNLKIDFAHIGSSDPSYVWANTVVRLVNENENVYSDLSCYINNKELDPIKKLWDKNPKLKTRMMFGTDFDVMYFTGAVTMQDYYQNFKSVFTQEELMLLMHDNPAKFMGIEN